MSYLGSIALVQTLPCLAEPGKVIIVGKPDRTLTDVIPYLAALPGIIAYNPNTCTITFRRQPGFLTIYPEKGISITQAQDTEEGLVLLDALRRPINSTWDHRHELRPAGSPNQPNTWIFIPYSRRPIADNAARLPVWHLR